MNDGDRVKRLVVARCWSKIDRCDTTLRALVEPVAKMLQDAERSGWAALGKEDFENNFAFDTRLFGNRGVSRSRLGKNSYGMFRSSRLCCLKSSGIDRTRTRRSYCRRFPKPAQHGRRWRKRGGQSLRYRRKGRRREIEALCGGKQVTLHARQGSRLGSLKG